MDPQDENELKSAHRTAAFAGISIIASLLVTLAVAEAIRAVLRPFRGLVSLQDPQRLRYALFAVAIAAVILIRILRPSLLRRAAASGRGLSLRRIQSAAIITTVLCEVPALAGLVLFLLGGFNVDFYLLLLVSLVLIFIYFPRLSQWRDLLKG